jgi:hypothetical protein
MRAHYPNRTLIIAALLLAPACSGTAEPPRAAAAVPVAARAEPAQTPTFINRVWRVSESSSVARGTLYVFLSDGTLLITSEQSKPMVGTWKHDGGILTMVEESIPYKVDILNLSAEEFRIRSNNPGGAVELRLVPAQ